MRRDDRAELSFFQLQFSRLWQGKWIEHCCPRGVCVKASVVGIRYKLKEVSPRS